MNDKTIDKRIIDNKATSNFGSRKFLVVILTVALLNGLMYLFLVPPWQHPDEPNHFEYAWLIANRREIPKMGDYDSEMRKQVAKSMIENGFFRGMGFLPDLNSEKPYIGTYSQVEDPPIYYILEAIPLTIFRNTNVAIQLYAARILSLLLYIMVVFITWKVAVEITNKENPLRILMPLFVSLLPSFVDLMTSVNSDVAAVFVFSFFVWGVVRFVRRGFSWLNLLWTVFFCLIGIWVKDSLIISIPILLIVLFLKIIDKWRWRILAIGLLMVFFITGGFLVLSTGDAAYWYRAIDQAQKTRQISPRSPDGEYSLAISTTSKVTPPWLPPVFQLIPLSLGRQLNGETLTIGFWMWADEPVRVNTPVFHHGSDMFGEQVNLSTEPTFFAYQYKLDNSNRRTWITFSPLKMGKVSNQIYLDGIVVAKGAYPLNVAPVLASNAGKGEWGRQTFQNLVRNGSFEDAWFYVNPLVDDFATEILPDNSRFSTICASLVDYKGAGWYYRLTAAGLFRTFWAKFGWGHVPLLGRKPYRALFAITILALIGFIFGGFREIKKAPWILVFLFVMVMSAFWLPTLVRGSIYIVFPHVYIPGARYAYPSIICLSAILTFGWSSILGVFSVRGKAQVIVLSLLFVLINLWAWVSIYTFYYI